MNLLGIIFLLASAAIGSIFKSKFKSYAKAGLQADLSGVEIADKMLRECGVTHIKITCTHGHLTDHYNPLTRTISLSDQVYHGKNVAAAAIAAHECGHAV